METEIERVLGSDIYKELRLLDAQDKMARLAALAARSIDRAEISTIQQYLFKEY